jgi:hypothetical protein
VTNPVIISPTSDRTRPVAIALVPGMDRLTVEEAIEAAADLMACVAEAMREEKRRAVEHQCPPRYGTRK